MFFDVKCGFLPLFVEEYESKHVTGVNVYYLVFHKHNITMTIVSIWQWKHFLPEFNNQARDIGYVTFKIVTLYCKHITMAHSYFSSMKMQICDILKYIIVTILYFTVYVW